MRDSQLHILPCKIEYVGVAPVTKYFCVKHVGQELQTSFRGMPLNGSIFCLPPHKVTAVLDSSFRLQGKIDSVVTWKVEGDHEAKSMYSVKYHTFSVFWNDILQ